MFGRLLALVGSLAVLTTVAGCGGGGSGSVATSNVTMSGQLSLTNTSAGFQKVLMESQNGDSSNDALAVSDYTAVCVTTSVPPLTGSGAVHADGTFNVQIDGAKGMPMSCGLVKTADNSKAADFLIEDSSKKDMNGNHEHSSTLTPSGDVNMSTITFNADTGEVTVPKSAVASAVDTAVTGTVFDPTGAWTLGNVDFTLPAGTRGVCTQAEQNSNSCNGPPDGQQVYMKLWDGQQNGSTIYGLQLWQSAAAFPACGSMIGLTTQQKTDIGVTFPNHASADGVFTYASSLTWADKTIGGTMTTATLTDGWKASTAKSQYQTNPDCGPVDVTFGSTTYTNAWKCGPDAANNNTYQVSLNGGCTIDSTGKPVNLTDWTIFNGQNACTMTTDTDNVKTNTCKGNATINTVSTAVTCVNKWVVTDSNNTILPNGTFDWTHLTSIPAKTACSTLGAYLLTQLRCYADYYWQSDLAKNSNACMPRINTDWSATTAAGFIKIDNKPESLIFFEQYKPFPDGTGGTLTSRQEHFAGVQVDSNTWVNCAVIETGVLSIKKVTDHKLLLSYQSSLVTSSTGKPACLANFTGKKTTFVFYGTN